MDLAKKAYELFEKMKQEIEVSKSDLPPAYVIEILIQHAVNIALCCAPKELDGIKMILSSVKDSISWYEENES